jgi:hypothetical protein
MRPWMRRMPSLRNGGTGRADAPARGRLLAASLGNAALAVHVALAVPALRRLVGALAAPERRSIVVPFVLEEMVAEVEAFVCWYDGSRPHSALGGATPNEIRSGVRPARAGPRFEVRPRYPTRRRDRLRAKKGTPVVLHLGHHEGRSHLPVIQLRAAA